MSWEWQWCWWTQHAARLGLQPVILAIYAADGTLCGIAPLHARRTAHRYGLSVTRLELVGSLWRESAAIFSECLDIIAARELEPAVADAVAQWLHSQETWDEIVLSYVRNDSVAAQLAASYSREQAYVRASDSMSSWRTTLGAFEDFAAGLSSTTRRKLLNHRSKLIAADFRRVPAERV